MTTPIPIPDDATEAQVKQLIEDASTWLRENQCAAHLRGGGGCRAGRAPHDEHWTKMAGTSEAGAEVTLTVTWRDPAGA